MTRPLSYRGRILLTLGLTDLAYGVLLIKSLAPGAGELNPDLWGWVWIGIGLALLVGSMISRDSAFWALAVLIKWFWALILLSAAQWPVSIVFLGFAAVILLCSGWPDHG